MHLAGIGLHLLDLVGDLEFAAVVAHAGVEARFAVLVDVGYLGVGIVVVERREVDRGVVGKRKTVFRVVHLHGREQHLVRRGEVIGRVGEFGADAGEPLDLLGTFGVDVGAQIFVGVVFRFDEVVVEVSDTPFEVVGDRRVGRILVEPVAVLLGVAYGLLRPRCGPAPIWRDRMSG